MNEIRRVAVSSNEVMKTAKLRMHQNTETPNTQSCHCWSLGPQANVIAKHLAKTDT